MEKIHMLDAKARKKLITETAHKILEKSEWDVEYQRRRALSLQRTQTIEVDGKLGQLVERKFTTQKLLGQLTTNSFILSTEDSPTDGSTGLRSLQSYLYIPYRDWLGVSVSLQDHSNAANEPYILQWTTTYDNNELNTFWSKLRNVEPISI